MTRAAQSLQAMRSSQSSARAAALAAQSAVPNGLTAGGLVVAPGAVPSVTDGGAGLWQGANLPIQTPAGGRTQVEIKQTQAKAILSWSSFNVGRETDLYFNQTAGGADVANWIALNRVTDPGLAPSRILGSIRAEGQVYIINRNGIIFGGSGQVNVHTLIASSLSLDNDQFMSGINVQRKINSGADNFYGLPTFGDHATEAPNKWVSLTHAAQVAPAPIGDPPADVIVEPGALIDIQTGGKAMLFAPHVANAGTIRAPDGQVILAAGEQVWLLPPKSVYANPLRGFDVAVSAASPYLLEYPQVANVTTEGAVTSAFHIAVQTILLPARTSARPRSATRPSIPVWSRPSAATSPCRPARWCRTGRCMRRPRWATGTDRSCCAPGDRAWRPSIRRMRPGTTCCTPGRPARSPSVRVASPR